ncbi:MAG TPA: hypothetical protein VJR92_13180 [Gemmatimonadaceae bacterium]|nr:hypothetical protein [Gemmatimonadaceae bacterium]
MKSRQLAFASLALYAVSWCVPVALTTGELLHGPIYGWQAFLFGMSPVFGLEADGFFIGAWMVIGSVSNLWLLGVLFRVWRGTLKRPDVLGWIAMLIAMLNTGWLLMPEAARDLRVGYYFWIGAFWLAAAATMRFARERAAPAVG